jgi:hypothetical protein
MDLEVFIRVLFFALLGIAVFSVNAGLLVDQTLTSEEVTH